MASQLRANLHCYTMKCSDKNNYVLIRNLVELLCPQGFAVKLLTSSRMKSMYKGGCVWNISYQLVTGNVTGKLAFKDAVKKLTINLPIGAELVGYGRCFDPDNGVIIHLGHKNCQCPMDFSLTTTPFLNLMELREFIFWFCESFTAESCIEAIWSLAAQCGGDSFGFLVCESQDDEENIKHSTEIQWIKFNKNVTLELCRRAVQIGDYDIHPHYRLACIRVGNPTKAAQMERLRMGFNQKSEMTHSAVTDIKTLTQEASPKFSTKTYEKNPKDEIFDDYLTVTYTAPFESDHELELMGYEIIESLNSNTIGVNHYGS